MIYSEIEKKSLNKNNNDDFFGFLKQSSWDLKMILGINNKKVIFIKKV